VALAQRSETRGGNTARSHRQVRRRRAPGGPPPTPPVDHIARRQAETEPDRQRAPRSDYPGQLHQVLLELNVMGRSANTNVIVFALAQLHERLRPGEAFEPNRRSLQRWLTGLERLGYIRKRSLPHPNGRTRCLEVTLLPVPELAQPAPRRHLKRERLSADEYRRLAGRRVGRIMSSTGRFHWVPRYLTPPSCRPPYGRTPAEKAVAGARATRRDLALHRGPGRATLSERRERGALLGAAVTAARQRMWTAAGEEEAQAVLATANASGSTLGLAVQLIGLQRPELLLGPPLSPQRWQDLDVALRVADRYAGIGRGIRGAAINELHHMLLADTDAAHGEPVVQALAGYAVLLQRTARRWRQAVRMRQRAAGARPPLHDRRDPYPEGKPPPRGPWILPTWSEVHL
jgi:hypothetical protein